MSKLLDTRFKDQKDREWFVQFDGNTMRSIKAELQINICDAMADTKAFTESLMSIRSWAWCGLPAAIKQILPRWTPRSFCLACTVRR